jgi:hypothetical protein
VAQSTVVVECFLKNVDHSLLQGNNLCLQLVLRYSVTHSKAPPELFVPIVELTTDQQSRIVQRIPYLVSDHTMQAL